MAGDPTQHGLEALGIHPSRAVGPGVPLLQTEPGWNTTASSVPQGDQSLPFNSNKIASEVQFEVSINNIVRTENK